MNLVEHAATIARALNPQPKTTLAAAEARARTIHEGACLRYYKGRCQPACLAAHMRVVKIREENR